MSNGCEDELMFAGIIIGIAALCIFQFLTGVYDNPIKELGVNESVLAAKYVVFQYPEYENCSISPLYYDEDFRATVDVFCGKGLDNRDGLINKMDSKSVADATIVFDKTSLKDVARAILNSYEFERK